MQNLLGQIFGEWNNGCNFKLALGAKGLYEQSRINERFYIGDQWYGAKCPNDRPLVRHNIIKRIGDYKMSQILGSSPQVIYTADGIPFNQQDGGFDEKNIGSGELEEAEINFMMTAFNNYHKVTAERVKLTALYDSILRNSYVSGTAVLYTYWDETVNTGLFADAMKTVKIKGDICCEVLNIEDIVFGDPYTKQIEKQPYIIISSQRDSEAVLREARLSGADLSTLQSISESADNGKITQLTKLFKTYNTDGSFTVKCIKVTEKGIVRKEFDTGLRMYPLSLFCWESKNDSIYGESEVTYLIPNQIAINRMITANVWSAMTAGMPIMLVNGDTVTEKITNDPGQIIKVYGSNEDVEGAVKYITPPSFAKNFDSSINALIENTLSQSGANEVALGDSKAENASALAAMRDAALMPLEIVKNRFYTFVEDTARIWAEFWVTYYGKRSIKIEDKSGRKYIPFNAERYREIAISAGIDVAAASGYTERERVDILLTLFDKGIIGRNQLLSRLPDGTVSDIKSLLNEPLEVQDERI